MPRFGREAQQQEFGRQRAVARREKGVDPGGVGRDRPVDRAATETGSLGLGGAVEPEHAHLLVDRHCRRTEDLGEPAGAVAPHQLHLKEPVLGMGKAEAEGRVVVVLRR